MAAEPTATGLRPETERLLSSSTPCGPQRTIVILGDSIVYGWGLPYESSYPAVLEAMLNRGSESPNPWRVVNAGIPGETVVMGWARYERDVSPWRPRLVLIAFGLNDGALRRSAYDVQREALWQARRSPWRRWLFRLRRLLPKAGRRRRRPISAARKQSPRVRPAIYERALHDLVRRARHEGAWVGLLSLTPVGTGSLSPAQVGTYERYNERIRAVSKRAKVPWLNLAAPGGEPFAPETMLAADGIHLTDAGQRWLATKAYQYLVERKLMVNLDRTVDSTYTTEPRA